MRENIVHLSATLLSPAFKICPQIFHSFTTFRKNSVNSLKFRKKQRCGEVPMKFKALSSLEVSHEVPFLIP